MATHICLVQVPSVLARVILCVPTMLVVILWSAHFSPLLATKCTCSNLSPAVCETDRDEGLTDFGPWLPVRESAFAFIRLSERA